MTATRSISNISNEEIAVALEEMGSLLDQQGANPFRVGAYHDAASVVRSCASPVTQILQKQGIEGLEELPKIGHSLSRMIQQLVTTGKIPLLEQLRAGTLPEHALTTVPGIGPELAKRIYDELNVSTLAELQSAAWDGRLAQLKGMGPRRVRGIRESIAGRFRPVSMFRPATSTNEPPVSELLDVDAEYRRKAAADRLFRIAPRRFNPMHQAWLPVLHTSRDNRHYTALYSNTAKAHELGTTHDWVVIYRDDHLGHGQWTAITSKIGNLRGKRIIRGREQECSEYYQRQSDELNAAD